MHTTQNYRLIEKEGRLFLHNHSDEMLSVFYACNGRKLRAAVLANSYLALPSGSQLLYTMPTADDPTREIHEHLLFVREDGPSAWQQCVIVYPNMRYRRHPDGEWQAIGERTTLSLDYVGAYLEVEDPIAGTLDVYTATSD